MTALAQRVLSRFPAHLEPEDPSKQLALLVDALAVPLGQLNLAIGGVRRAHRLGDAEVMTDALRVAAMHRLTPADHEILTARFTRAGQLAAALAAAAADDERQRLAEELCGLWGLAAEAPRLGLFDPQAETAEQADPGRAAAALLEAVAEQLTLSRRIEAIEHRVEAQAALHVAGNGTVGAVLAAAANLLDLDVVGVFHSEDRFWHAATVRDRLRLARRRGDAGGDRPLPLAPATEIIGLEENPRRRRETGAEPRAHAELFSIVRKGFGTARLETRITGMGERARGPMLVNRDEGRGVGYAGLVPDGERLVITEEGRGLLGGADVTAGCYAWQGACFAGDDAAAERDFAFVGDATKPPPPKPASFAVATPAGTLDPGARFPHGGDSLPVPGVAVGETRYAFFVRAAHFSGAGGTPRLVAPRPFLGTFDESLFDPRGGSQPSAELELSWLEHEAYVARLLLPARFRGFTPPAAEESGFRPVAEGVVAGLQRIKPAGVEIRVEYVDDRWVMDRGVLAGEAADNPIDSVRGGIRLWAPDAEDE